MEAFFYRIYLNGEDWAGGVFYTDNEEDAVRHAQEQGERRKEFYGETGTITCEVAPYRPQRLERVLLNHIPMHN